MLMEEFAGVREHCLFISWGRVGKDFGVLKDFKVQKILGEISSGFTGEMEGNQSSSKECQGGTIEN